MSQSAEVVPRSDLGERPLRELVKDLWENTQKLFRQEVELATTELDAKMSRFKRELLAVAIAVAAAYAGVLALLAAIILILAEFMVAWLSALIVGGATTLAGIALLIKAKHDLRPRELAPERMLRSLKTDVQMLKEATQ
jgi:predicted phage tail protein